MKQGTAVLLAMLLLASNALAVDATDARLAASREAVQAFQGALQAELQAAIRAGGPVSAIEVCSTRAPAIAAQLSNQQSMRIRRTSLRLRNAANAPDAWERKVLERFQQRSEAGENPAGLEFYETITRGGEPVFRYMKAIAIPQGSPCLACHGQTIDERVAAKLKQLYPNDEATGFRAGELRGAFSITRPL